ncbi:MAG: FG-GAP repeat protein [Deltaproteobacteria bacterium]|nr:FG-GAP repeat protein [Deltaproteobacteria bacterium]
MTKILIPVVMLCQFFLNFAPCSFASQRDIQHFNIFNHYERQKASSVQKNILPKIDLHALKMETSKKPKIGPVLNNFLAGKDGASLTMTGPDRDRVRLIMNTAEDNPYLYDAISRNNAKILHKRNGSIALDVPFDKIESLVNATEAVKNVRLPVKFHPMEVITEGVELTGANLFHIEDYNGAGVRIAVMDVGFMGLTDAYRNGDIPYGARTYDFTDKGIETEYYHGTACAEILYDMAPDAELYLLRISDEIDIYNAVDYCIENGIDIISMSIGTFGTGPGDGTGPLDEYFDHARDNGILVVASAGNYANMEVDFDADGYVDFTIGSHWEGKFYDPDNNNIHEFTHGPVESTYNVIGAYPSQDDDGNPDTSEVSILLRWNDWIDRKMIDYDLYLYEYDLINDSIGDLAGYSNITQDRSQPPMEYISIDLADDEDTQYYALVVQKKTGALSVELEIYLGGTSTFLPFHGSSSAFATSESSMGEPADAESVLAVSAIYYGNWENGPKEDFASQGPTNAWAGSGSRTKPDICGPDGISTYIRGAGTFFGTSAVTPHVAGAAALALSLYPDLSPDELQSYLETNAIDMGDEGKDNLYGSGSINIGFNLIKKYQKINCSEGDFSGALDDGDKFGQSIASIGDLDGDGVTDIAIGAIGDDDEGSCTGAVWILFLNPDGTVKSHQKISDTEGNFTGYIFMFDYFGKSLAPINDLDGDGIFDLAVTHPGAESYDAAEGAVWILFLNTDGTVKSHQKISDTEGNFMGVMDENDYFGQSVTSLGDFDGDGVNDIAVGAVDVEDGAYMGIVWILFLNPDGTVKSHQKISDTEGNFTGVLVSGDGFGESIASIGDLDGDGVTDLAVGAPDDVKGYNYGAVWILFLNPDGTVKYHQKIKNREGNFTGVLNRYDNFGKSITPVGDLNGDGVVELAVGATDYDFSSRGAVWILFLNPDGTVKYHQKISDTEGYFTGTLDDEDNFGQSVETIGDLDGDEKIDLAFGAIRDDDGIASGAVWILFLNYNFNPDNDNDEMPDNWEDIYYLNISSNDSGEDPDNDGYTNIVEYISKTDPLDADTDDDGILDSDEDTNMNSSLDNGETFSTKMDSDGDALHDGTELGITSGISDTDTDIFIPDSDPSATTDPMNADTDGDGLRDGKEDSNQNGRFDSGETDPNVFDIIENDIDTIDDGTDISDNDSGTSGSGGGGGGGCFIETVGYGSRP